MFDPRPFVNHLAPQIIEWACRERESIEAYVGDVRACELFVSVVTDPREIGLNADLPGHEGVGRLGMFARSKLAAAIDAANGGADLSDVRAIRLQIRILP